MKDEESGKKTMIIFPLVFITSTLMSLCTAGGRIPKDAITMTQLPFLNELTKQNQ